MAYPMQHLLICLSLLSAAAASAADGSASAAAALKVLTQPTHEAPAQPATAPAARETLTVQRSETLDMLVRRHYAGWPFKDEVMRRALAELNPKAIPNAANNLLKRGSVLLMPNTEDMRRTLLQHYPAAAELVRIKVEREAEESAAGAHASALQGPDKRRWVRFP